MPGHAASGLLGSTPLAVVLMRWLIAGASPDEIDATLTALLDRSPRAVAPNPLRARVDALRRTLREHRHGAEQLVDMLSSGARAAAAVTEARGGLDACAAFFDACVIASEGASVASYTLGDPGLLHEATEEVARLLRDWSLVTPGRAILQIGCGTGRFEAVLAPSVRLAFGVDISPRMIEAARRRCAGLPNVRLSVCSGADLDGVDSASIDLVYAVDTFPYIHQLGPGLLHEQFREISRVLGPGGDLAIFNFSYRDDASADAAELHDLAGAHGFEVLVAGVAPFRLWDGLGFHLRRSSVKTSESGELEGSAM